MSIRSSRRMLEAEVVRKEDPPVVKWAKRNKSQRLERMVDFEVSGVTHTLTLHHWAADLLLK